MQTFKIISRLDESIIKTLLLKRGNWKEGSDDDKTFDFIHVDINRHSKIDDKKKKDASEIQAWKKATVKNQYDKINELTYKSNLYKHLSNNFKTHPTYMKKSWIVKNYDDLKKLEQTLNFDLPYIVKPTEEYAGSGIKVVDDYEGMRSHVSQLHRGKKDAIISEYINKPLLFEKKKFHLRMYFIIHLTRKKKKVKMTTYLCNIGFIYTAELPYIADDYENPKIHDSHFKSTKKDNIYPDKFKKTFGAVKEKEIKQGMIDILVDVSSKYSKILKPYKETKEGYYIHGTDFMIDSDWNLILLEINKHTWLGTHTKAGKVKLTKALMDSVACDILDISFPPTKKSRCKSKFTKVYEN
jgi:hypothetical protein